MPTIDRHALRFTETVEENFSFLYTHGFERVKNEPTFIRFESKRAYVNVYHGMQSFELGLEIGPLESTHPEKATYSMSEIIRLLEPDRADEYRNYAADSTDGVAEGVRRLATLFRRYLDAGVLDDVGVFERLQKKRETWSHDFAREVNLTQTRRKLEVAWQVKDYAEVVAVLRPLRGILTPSELQKLEYAEKHIGRSGARP